MEGLQGPQSSKRVFCGIGGKLLPHVLLSGFGRDHRQQKHRKDKHKLNNLASADVFPVLPVYCFILLRPLTLHGFGFRVFVCCFILLMVRKTHCILRKLAHQEPSSHVALPTQSPPDTFSAHAVTVRRNIGA